MDSRKRLRLQSLTVPTVPAPSLETRTVSPSPLVTYAAGQTNKYTVFGIRAAQTVTGAQTLIEWTGQDAFGSARGRNWVSTNSSGQLQVHNPSDPTAATTVTALGITGFSFGTTQGNTVATQILLEVLKSRPNTPSDDGIDFLITAIRADGTVVQCNNIGFSSGWRVFNLSAIHLFEFGGTIPIDRVKLALHAGYDSHASIAAQVASPNHNAPVAWGIRTTGTAVTVQAYNGDFDFKGTLRAYNDKNELQDVVLSDDARLSGDGNGGGGGGATINSRELRAWSESEVGNFVLPEDYTDFKFVAGMFSAGSDVTYQRIPTAVLAALNDQMVGSRGPLRIGGGQDFGWNRSTRTLTAIIYWLELTDA